MKVEGEGGGAAGVGGRGRGEKGPEGEGLPSLRRWAEALGGGGEEGSGARFRVSQKRD